MVFIKSYCFKTQLNLQYVGKLLHLSSSFANYTEYSLKPKFNESEQAKILDIINQSNRDELQCLNIAQNKVKSLENYKKKNGPFKSLNELLEVDGLSVKLLEKLCKQIITNGSPEQVKQLNNENKKIKQILGPQLPANHAISSAVGVHLAPTGISWAKVLQKENQLESWGYKDFVNLPKKMFPTDTFKLATDILYQLPVGDAYIFEGTSSMSLQGQKQPTVVASYTQQLELSSMLLALINTSSRHNIINQNNKKTDSNDVINVVYFLRSKLPARLFKTLVGNECVSSTTTVLRLLGDLPLDNIILPCTPITVDQKLKNDYASQSPPHKELLGQALMLTVAFINLCIKKNPISIKAIIPGKK